MDHPTISIPALILETLLTDAIDLNDARLYWTNYQHFERNRSRIEAQYPGQWVASVNGKLFTGGSYEAARSEIVQQPHDDRAYIELVGR
jgi:hypothetical protein